MVEPPAARSSPPTGSIVCAGLESDRLARASGQDAEPRIIPFRGEYWKLRPERAELVRGLIYPVPDPALPFLGVHLTRRVGGEVWLGPNAVLALALEGYRWRDVRARDVAHILGWPGTWRMMRRNWRAGLRELLVSRRKRLFVAEARRFVPALEPGDAVRAGRRGPRPGGRPRRLAGRRLPHRPRPQRGLGPQRALAGGHLLAGDRQHVVDRVLNRAAA